MIPVSLPIATWAALHAKLMDDPVPQRVLGAAINEFERALQSAQQPSPAATADSDKPPTA